MLTIRLFDHNSDPTNAINDVDVEILPEKGDILVFEESVGVEVCDEVVSRIHKFGGQICPGTPIIAVAVKEFSTNE